MFPFTDRVVPPSKCFPISDRPSLSQQSELRIRLWTQFFTFSNVCHWWFGRRLYSFIPDSFNHNLHRVLVCLNLWLKVVCFSRLLSSRLTMPSKASPPPATTPTSGYSHVAALYDDKLLLVFGRTSKSKSLNDLYSLDFETVMWSRIKWYIVGSGSRKKNDNAASLRTQHDQHKGVVENLVNNTRILESTIQDAKSKKDNLKARAQSAKTATKVSEMLVNVNTSSALSAFEKMEEKVMTMESQAEALNQLTSDDLEGKVNFLFFSVNSMQYGYSFVFYFGYGVFDPLQKLASVGADTDKDIIEFLMSEVEAKDITY
ncbi:unnamed protein product [Lactuca virosa]|uniref:Uncharacterized protein n=1 Tax=Lactuca virosa TaxID=75947 RepID=A0AAU9PLA4_9ASTR|nr:unnamed protein product [Lactuca virosa]